MHPVGPVATDPRAHALKPAAPDAAAASPPPPSTVLAAASPAPGMAQPADSEPAAVCGSSPPVSPSRALLKFSPNHDACKQLVWTLQRHRSARPFSVPVDPVALNIPDYFTIVKRPMDLGTVVRKLEQDQYATAADVFADVQLVWDNAILYNPPTDPVAVLARELADYSAQLRANAERKLVARLPPTTTDLCVQCGGDISHDSNRIVFCDACNSGYHQACHGVDVIPAGNWYCAPCERRRQEAAEESAAEIMGTQGQPLALTMAALRMSLPHLHPARRLRRSAGGAASPPSSPGVQLRQAAGQPGAAVAVAAAAVAAADAARDATATHMAGGSAALAGAELAGGSPAREVAAGGTAAVAPPAMLAHAPAQHATAGWSAGALTQEDASPLVRDIYDVVSQINALCMSAPRSASAVATTSVTLWHMLRTTAFEFAANSINSTGANAQSVLPVTLALLRTTHEWLVGAPPQDVGQCLTWLHQIFRLAMFVAARPSTVLRAAVPEVEEAFAGLRQALSGFGRPEVQSRLGTCTAHLSLRDMAERLQTLGNTTLTLVFLDQRCGHQLARTPERTLAALHYSTQALYAIIAAATQYASEPTVRAHLPPAVNHLTLAEVGLPLLTVTMQDVSQLYAQPRQPLTLHFYAPTGELLSGDNLALPHLTA